MITFHCEVSTKDVERVHKEWVIAGQAGNRRPTPVFTSYMISTFYH